ncbi:MAG: ribonuclease HI [Corynebacterium sp.]|uniref:RNase H family protein n=1 Tax=Corynebacterium sp. TaxID=1720 RepID=UPI0017A87E90|nr:RNase H family protein [Corynebacterium sp.]NWO17694.1 ribonuclease HI [Corynebacterium sp.]
MPEPRLDLEALLGTKSRTYKTRQVTEDMVQRPIHVAIALWDQPWKSAHNQKIEGWVIAVDSKRARFVRRGRTTKGDVVERTLAELNDALKNLRGKAWIVTGRRQAGLRLALEEQGHLVTGSFSEKNRAGKRASMQRKKDDHAALREAKKTGEAPDTVKTTQVPTTPAHWWPQFGSDNARPQNDELVRIATDASSDTVYKGSMCFVANNGDFQLRTAKTKASTDELELESLTLALKYLHKVGATQAVIESDSVAALEAVDYILSGEKPRTAPQQRQGQGQGQRNSRRRNPRGRTWRGLTPGSRSRFHQAWKDLNGQCDVKIRRVLGHAGDPLNQAADQIAYMGLRAIAHPLKEARPTLKHGINKAIKKAKVNAVQGADS